jgi:hypothetical protein
MATEMKDTFDNFFKQATETVQNTVNTGVRFTEEMSRFWTRPMTGNHTFDDVRRRGETMATEVIGLVQKNAAEGQKGLDAQCRNSMDLTRKTFETIAADDVSDMRDKTFNLCNTMFDAVRKSTEIGMNTGMQMFENWTSFFTKSMNQCEAKKAVAGK